MNRFVAVAALFAASGAASAQQPPKQKTPAELLALADPGPEHEKMAKYAGKWELEVKMGGGANALAYTGTAESRMTVGKRFLQIEYETKGKAGPLDGAFTVGFDRRHEHFNIIALDTFGTYAVASQGKADEKTGKVKMLGKDDDPVMKALGFTKEFVHLLEYRGADEFGITVLFIDTRTKDRKEIKAMEYTFKRKK